MAQYNTFFIPHGDTGAQQETLNAFLRAHRVLKVEKSVFPEGWAFCVEWMDGAAGGVQPPYAAYQREKIDYMKVLPPEVFARFSELRKRRKEIADADGVKPFVVMTDAQLAKAAEFEKPTVADLKKIDRFASGRRGAPTLPTSCGHAGRVTLPGNLPSVAGRAVAPRPPRFGYVRYMDDFVYWCDDKAALIDLRERLAAFVESQLGLSLKQTPYVNRTSKGMDFLGMRVYPQTIEANRASLDRFKRKVRIYDWELAQGYWDEATYQQRMSALTAFLQAADTLGWRRQFLRKDEGRRRGASGSNRVIRGGSWNNNAQNCRSANRNNNNPSNNNNNNGFRLCCSAAPQDEREDSAVPAVVPFPQGTKSIRPAAAGSAARRERRGRGFLARRGSVGGEPTAVEGNRRWSNQQQSIAVGGYRTDGNRWQSTAIGIRKGAA